RCRLARFGDNSDALTKDQVMRQIVLSVMRAMIVAPLLHVMAQAAPSSPTSQTRIYGGNTSGDKGLSRRAAPVPPTPSTTIAKNIITDFGAKCYGVANDAPAFMRFNSWARAQTLPITLTIPPGSICNFASTPATFAAGIKNLVVSGYDSKFVTTLNSFFLGG